METKKFTNIQDFMRFLNYSKEDIWVKNNKAYNASKQEVAELIINNGSAYGVVADYEYTRFHALFELLKRGHLGKK